MSFKSLAVAAALAVVAAPAFASPASVIPDTGHSIVRGTKQIVSGTYHGVAHQVGNAGYAARSTGHSVVRGVHHITRRRHHHRHFFHRHTGVHHVNH